MRRRSSMSSTSPHTSPPASTDRSREHGAFATAGGRPAAAHQRRLKPAPTCNTATEADL